MPKFRILKIEKFAVELYDLNRFFAIFSDFSSKIKLHTGKRLEMTTFFHGPIHSAVPLTPKPDD